jgi:hypothetical protein
MQCGPHKGRRLLQARECLLGSKIIVYIKCEHIDEINRPLILFMHKIILKNNSVRVFQMLLLIIFRCVQIKNRLNINILPLIFLELVLPFYGRQHQLSYEQG